MSPRSPLAAVVLALWATPALAFNLFEHKEIGDRGLVSALAALEQATPGSTATLLSRPHLREGQGLAAAREVQVAAVADGRAQAWFSFGDLVGAYGDQAVDVAEVNSRAIERRAPLLRRMLVEGMAVADDAERARMLALVAVNVTHFAGGALEAYVKGHREALRLAREPGRLAEALHHEALALHSYTDLFAVGHMIEERARTQELLTWFEKQGAWLAAPLKKLLGRAVGSVLGLWANFYHNAFNFRGAQVTNADGDTWQAFGDARYRVVTADCAETTLLARRACADPTTERQRAIIDAGVSRSVLAVLRTALGQTLGAGEAMAALAKLPIAYAQTQRPLPPGQQKMKLLRLLTTLGRSFAKAGFDFSLGILEYGKEVVSGVVRYADAVRKHLAAR